MIDGKIEIKLNKLDDLIRKAPGQAEQIVRAMAQEGRNIVVLSLQERSPGEIQTRYNPYRQVVAAAPGETPNTDTGNLVNSVQIEPVSQFTQAIVVGAEYGPILELGGVNMEARPYMGPMAQKLERDGDRFIADFRRGMGI